MKKKPSKRAQIQAKRREYEQAKSAWHRAGELAFEKPKNSRVHREYENLKRVYRRVGAQLGRLTGVR